MKLLEDIAKYGGLAATHELLAAGHSQHGLGRAAAAGCIIRVRQGWYCMPGTNEMLVQAVRVGGRLSCISGAEYHSLWVRHLSTIHVEVSPRTSRLRSTHDRRVRLADCDAHLAVVHWSDKDAGGTRFVLNARDCLRRLVHCKPAVDVVAAADSALRAGQITLAQWATDISNLPPTLRSLLNRVDPRSESIIESFTRFRLQCLGLDPNIQVLIAGVGRVDMVVGAGLVIELDGWEYHSDRNRFELDRRRDARLSARGYRVLRFSYHQVMSSWFEVRSAICAAVARGDHLV